MGRETPVDWRRRLIYAGSALGLLALAALLLALTADDSPQMWRRLFGRWRLRDAAAPLGLGGCALVLFAAAWSRHALLAVLASGLGLAATWLAVEVVSISGLVHWPTLIGPSVTDLGAQAVPNLDISGTTYQDTASAWGMPSEPIEFRYRTDRRGFRNEPDRADADVYLLGDSMLVSALLPFGETLAAQLDARLPKQVVVQVALNAVGPEREQELFRESGLEPSGRLVVQAIFEGNDLGDTRERRLRASGVPRAETARLAERTFLRQIVTRLLLWTQPVAGAAALRTCQIGDQTYTFAWTREAYEPFAGEASAITASLDAFAREVGAAGGRFGVVLVPDKLRVLAPLCRFPAGTDLVPLAPHLSPLRDALLRWSATSRVALLDLTEPLASAAQAGRIPWFWGDTHWNAVGNEVAADALASWSLVREAR